MSLSAKYVDGELIQSGNVSTTQTAERNTASSDLDKDAFLQLLVAQMKYQDPLEPTSNTEYISQYATFSELEEMQNMAGNLTLSRASEAVGKEVIIETSDSKGVSKTVQGFVEKVVYNGSKAYLSIDGTLYSIDDLKQVLDNDYYVGSNAVEDIERIVGKLPRVEALAEEDVADVYEAFTIYNEMSDYQKSLLPADVKDKLLAYGEKADELIAVMVERAKNEAASSDEALDDETLNKLLEDNE